MRISTLILAAVATIMPVATAAQAYDFEEGGLYYKVYGEEVRVVKPETYFTYTGEVTLPTKVTHDGVTYPVNFGTSAFQNSSVTAFTAGEGWGEKTIGSVSLHRSALSKVTLMTPGTYTEPANGLANIKLLCDYTEVAKGTLSFDGEHHTLSITDFNVFDGEGKEFVPVIWGEGSQKITEPTVSEANGRKVYSFTLSKDLTADYGEQGGILPLPYYDICLAYVKVGESYACIRFTIGKYDTGTYYSDGTLRYALYNNELVVIAPADGVYSDDIVVPATLDVEGKTLPVTRIAPSAFEESAITSVTLPASIVEMGSYAFYGCPLLETVDLSACGNLSVDNTYAFADNLKLREVKMPAKAGVQTFSWAHYFDNCPELPSISLPQGGGFSYTFDGCTNIINLNIISNDEETAVFTIAPNIFQNDGTTAIAASPQSENVTSTTGSDGKTVYTVKKADLYQGKRYVGNVPFVAVNDDNYLRQHPESVLFNVKIPEQGESGVALPTVDNADAPVEYYNLQGVRVAAPSHGLYIRRQGNTAAKVIL